MDKNKSRAAIYLTAILTAVFMIIASFIIGRNSGITSDTGLKIDTKAVSWSASVDDGEHGGIKIPGYGDIYFPADETSVKITLYNPEANNCLFSFELYLDNDENPISSTGLIEPGKAVTEAELNRALNIGEYELKIKVNVFSAEGKTMNNAIVKTKLFVI